MPKSHRAFSLVELLVVIAILALLAGVLLPALLRARAQAQMATCVNNQRQIAAAALLWAGDNSDTLPPAATFWRELSLPTKTLRCLAAPRQPNGYVYSARVAGKPLGEIIAPERCLLTGDGESADHLAHTSVDFAPRHHGRIVAAYVDGHAALAPPPGDGLLVMALRRPGPVEVLLLVGLDGHVQEVVEGFFLHLSCSPDGQHIAFMDSHGLQVMNSDGTGKRLLLKESEGAYGSLQWSPDSRSLVFCVSDIRTNRIAIMGLDEQRPHPLTGTDLSYMRPTWSPDGRTIAFAACPANNSHAVPEIYRIHADGSGLQRLPLGYATSMSFSPDGQQLAYFGGATPGDWPPFDDLCVSDLAGKNIRCLFTSTHLGDSPQFSPDGRTIAFAEQLDEEGKLKGETVICLLDVHTGHVRRLTALTEQYSLSYTRDDFFCWKPW